MPAVVKGERLPRQNSLQTFVQLLPVSYCKAKENLLIAVVMKIKRDFSFLVFYTFSQLKSKCRLKY